MERIKQAIERARAERSDRGTAEHAALPPRPDDTARGQPSSMPAPSTIKVSWPSLYEKRVVGGPDASALLDTYRVLRTRVLQRMIEREARTLAVTSANPGEGKTLTAVNLAISLARKTPVLLIDADLRRPSIHRLFSVKPSAGLAECLADEASVGDCLFSPGIDDLAILPGGVPVENSSELLASSGMHNLLRTLTRSEPGRLLVFDLPPLLTSDDALSFSPHVEAVLLVVEEGRTTSDELTRATELLSSSQLLGTVLNKSEQASQAYYYRPPG